MATYEDFQALESSEKTVLIKLRSSKRLMAWALHSGSVYKVSAPSGIYLYSLEQDGTALTRVSVVPTGAGEFWHDHDNNLIYVRTSDSSNPNGKFIAATYTNYYASSAGVHLSVNFSDKYAVHWLPLVKSTSKFGFALDNKEFLGFALEGAGSVEFLNDRDYWDDKFDKWYWDNQEILIYSWNRELAASEAKLIFRGLTQSRKWSAKSIQFKLKDTLKELRQPLVLDDLSDYPSSTVPISRAITKQRLLYGRVYGHVPSNVDSTLPQGNTLSGTVSTTTSSATITGSSTTWLNDVTPNDVLIIGSDSAEYAVATVTSDTSIVLTDSYAGTTASGKTHKIKSEFAKRYQNRKFLVAGHSLKEPVTTVSSSNKIDKFTVADDSDFFVGAEITVDGEYTDIVRVSNNVIEVLPALSVIPSASDDVILSSIWDVYLNENLLDPDRGDYTFSAADGTITLDELAEFNIAPAKKLTGTVSLTSGSRNVTGTSTSFSSQLKSGDWILRDAGGVWHEILFVTDDTHLILRVVSGGTGSSTQFKTPLVYKEEEVTLSASVMGATENGVKTGVFIGTGALAVKDILKKSGLTSDLVEATFNTASVTAPQVISMAIPTNVTDRKTDKVRDIINKINQSIFGSLYQNDDFSFEYSIIEPSRTTNYNLYIEPDILGFSVITDSSKIVKEVIIEYLFKEFDSTSKEKSNLEETHSSETAEYLGKTSDKLRVGTVLAVEADAKVFAQRWAFIREVVSSVVKFKTALQASQLHIHDRIKLDHSKLYERFGSASDKVKVAGITSIKRDLSTNDVQIDDVGNSFARTSAVTENTANIFGSATDSEKQIDGYITDNYGLINDDEDTYSTNSIW